MMPIRFGTALARSGEAEQLAALAVLGVTDLDYPWVSRLGDDGHPENLPSRVVLECRLHGGHGARLVALIRKYRPEVMTVYDPFGDTDTPDTSR